MMLRRLRHTILLLSILNVGIHRLQGQNFTATKTDEGTWIAEDNSKIFFYQIKPKSLNGRYERANYLHPLYTLKGNILTEDFPKDHLHQRGIYWAWHQIIYNGRHIADGWSCENISWEVVNSRIRKNKKRITLDNDVLWKSVLQGENQTPVVRENSKITVHRANNEYRIIDFDIKLSPLLDSIEIGGSDDPKGYSGFSLRLKLPDDITFLTKDREVKAQELAVKVGPWLDFRGSFDGENSPECGVAVFCHPLNPGYPEPWIIRSEKSMQNPAFPGREPVALTRQGWHLRYRMVIHKDSFDVNDLEKLYQEYMKKNL